MKSVKRLATNPELVLINEDDLIHLLEVYIKMIGVKK